MSQRDAKNPLLAPLELERAFAESVEWPALTPAQVAVASDAARVMEFAKGEVLAPEGSICEGVFIVRSGLVAVRKGSASSRPHLFRLFRPGETLGLQPLMAEGPWMANVEAILPTSVWYFDRHFIMLLVRDNSDVAASILKRFALYLTAEVEKSFARESVELKTRVHQLLLDLDGDFGLTGPDGERITELPVSRNDIADMLGARRETVSRLITELRDEGVIELRGRHLRIEP